MQNIPPTAWITLAAVASGLIRVWVSPGRKTKTFAEYLRGAVVAGFVGLVATSVMIDENGVLVFKYGLVAICLLAFGADDLLVGLITLSKRLRKDPWALLDFINRARGGKKD